MTVLSKQDVVGLEIAEYEASWPGDATPVSPAPLLTALDPLLSRF
jgi:arginase